MGEMADFALEAVVDDMDPWCGRTGFRGPCATCEMFDQCPSAPDPSAPFSRWTVGGRCPSGLEHKFGRAAEEEP